MRLSALQPDASLKKHFNSLPSKEKETRASLDICGSLRQLFFLHWSLLCAVYLEIFQEIAIMILEVSFTLIYDVYSTGINCDDHYLQSLHVLLV
jgi:hypothetical protein